MQERKMKRFSALCSAMVKEQPACLIRYLNYPASQIFLIAHVNMEEIEGA